MLMSKAKFQKFDRDAIARKALNGAIAVRSKGKLDQHSPICIYHLCETLGVTVRFNNINMEGMYERGHQPRIHLSAQRPLPRRKFSCAHELGHHYFKHGSTIDEMKDRSKENSWDDPDEFLVDVFAGHLLMPLLGIKHAFSVRGWKPEDATAAQLYVVACDFGVGYKTFVTHLAVSLRLISFSRAEFLKRQNPKSIRATYLQELTPNPLIVSDINRVSTTTDAEVGTLLLLPGTCKVDGNGASFIRDIGERRLFQAVNTGIWRATTENDLWSAFIRIARKEYVGLAQYRHLEAVEDDEE